jgi:FMN-dependent NADH-azoreductase
MAILFGSVNYQVSCIDRFTLVRGDPFMSTVLVLNSSANGAASVSRQLVQGIVARLQADEPQLRLVSRDLGEQPIPHLTAATVGAIGPAEPADVAQAATRALSDELIAELQAADTIVIGAPMYNFGIASTLKTWFDHVLRAGQTFRYTEAGPEGLVKGKRAIVAIARAGHYTDGPAQPIDFQEPYLRHLLGFIGITDVTFVRAERLAFGPEVRAESIAAAQAVIARLGAAELSDAA